VKEESEVLLDVNYVRALNMLERQIESPKFLIAFWRAVGDFNDGAPWPEFIDPWWDGLEHIIHMD